MDNDATKPRAWIGPRIIRILTWRFTTASLGAAVSVGLIVSACSMSPSRPEQLIEVSAEDFQEYWLQLERRSSSWFEGNPPNLPAPEVLAREITWVQVPAAYLETCTFSSGSFRIEIGHDKWQSGCVPHELGHAALRMIGHPCWDDFEHTSRSNAGC